MGNESSSETETNDTNEHKSNKSKLTTERQHEQEEQITIDQFYPNENENNKDNSVNITEQARDVNDAPCRKLSVHLVETYIGCEPNLHLRMPPPTKILTAVLDSIISSGSSEEEDKEDTPPRNRSSLSHVMFNTLMVDIDDENDVNLFESEDEQSHNKEHSAPDPPATKMDEDAVRRSNQVSVSVENEDTVSIETISNNDSDLMEESFVSGRKKSSQSGQYKVSFVHGKKTRRKKKKKKKKKKRIRSESEDRKIMVRLVKGASSSIRSIVDRAVVAESSHNYELAKKLYIQSANDILASAKKLPADSLKNVSAARKLATKYIEQAEKMMMKIFDHQNWSKDEKSKDEKNSKDQVSGNESSETSDESDMFEPFDEIIFDDSGVYRMVQTKLSSSLPTSSFTKLTNNDDDNSKKKKQILIDLIKQPEITTASEKSKSIFDDSGRDDSNDDEIIFEQKISTLFDDSGGDDSNDDEIKFQPFQALVYSHLPCAMSTQKSTQNAKKEAALLQTHMDLLDETEVVSHPLAPACTNTDFLDSLPSAPPAESLCEVVNKGVLNPEEEEEEDEEEDEDSLPSAPPANKNGSLFSDDDLHAVAFSREGSSESSGSVSKGKVKKNEMMNNHEESMMTITVIHQATGQEAILPYISSDTLQDIKHMLRIAMNIRGALSFF